VQERTHEQAKSYLTGFSSMATNKQIPDGTPFHANKENSYLTGFFSMATNKTDT
jgi:hypothetical protein